MTVDNLSHRFKQLRKLTSVSSGTLWIARDLKKKRLCALRTINFPSDYSDDDIFSFQDSFYRLKMIKSPYLAELYEFHNEDSSCFFTYELIDGVNLNKIKDIPRYDVYDIFVKIARGLQDIHNYSRVHANLNPRNILVLSDRSVKLVDYCLFTWGKLTDPAYSAPELFIGEKPSIKSDLFSYGVVFYEFLTGRLPFNLSPDASVPFTGSAVETLYFPENIDRKVVFLLKSLLSPDPEKRMNDSMELLDKIEDIRSSESAPLKKETSQNHEKLEIDVTSVAFTGHRDAVNYARTVVSKFLATGLNYTIAFEGDSGIGKSRLLKEIRKFIPAGRSLTIYIESTKTENLLRRIFRKIFNIISVELQKKIMEQWGPFLLADPATFDFLAEYASNKSEKLDTIEGEEQRLISVIGEIFDVIAAEMVPLVFIIDDYDQADKKSLNVLNAVFMNAGQRTSFLSIFTATVSEERNLPEISSKSRFLLKPFSLQNMTAFIAACMGRICNEIDSDLATWIHRSSKGLPKSAVTLIYWLYQLKMIFLKEGKICMDEFLFEKKDIIPIVEKRLDSLSENEKMVLKTVSVYRSFATKAMILFSLNNMLNEEEIDAALRNLKKARFIEENSSAMIHFTLKEIQIYLYNRMTDAERNLMHLKQAEFLVTENSMTNVNALGFAAYHYLRAGEVFKALRFYLLAASTTSLHLNREMTVTYLEEATYVLTSSKTVLTEKQKAAVYLFIGKTLYGMGLYTKAVPHLKKAYKQWVSQEILEMLVLSLIKDSHAKTAEKLVEQYKSIPGYLKNFADYLETIVYAEIQDASEKLYHKLEKCRENFWDEKIFNKRRRYMLQEIDFRFNVKTRKVSFEELKQMYDKLIKTAESLSSKIFIVDAKNNKFILHWTFNDIDTCFDIAQETLSDALAIHDNYRIARAYNNLSVAAYMTHRFSESSHYLDKATEYALKGSGFSLLKTCYLNKGEMSIITGDYAISENYLFRAEELATKDNNEEDLISIYLLQVILFTLKKQMGTARNIGNKLRRLVEKSAKDISKPVYANALLAILFMDAVSRGEEDFFIETSRKLEMVFSSDSYRSIRNYSYLFYLTSQIIFDMSMGREDAAYRKIQIVKKNNISSPYNFYRVVYAYYAAKSLSDMERDEEMFKHYLDSGLNMALEYGSKNFVDLFRELSFSTTTDDHEKIISEIEAYDTAINSSLKDSFYESMEKMKFSFKEKKRHIEYLSVKNKHFAEIIELLKTVSGISNIDRLLDTIVKKLINFFNADIVAMVLKYESNEEEEHKIRDSVMNTYGLSDIVFKGGILAKMHNSGKIQFLSNVKTSTIDVTEQISSEERTYSVLAAPIIVQGEIKAYIYIERASVKGSFIENEINFIELVTDNIGYIIDNVKLFELATTDSLTKLYTRRHFASLAAKDFEKARKYTYPLSLLMLDIDFFKNVNDTYGHLMGDAVLKAFGKMIKQNIRSSDYAGRLGGEEFAIVLSGTDIKGAMETAEKLRKKCETTDFSGLKITASIGCAQYNAAFISSPEELVECADSALYKAKKSGRNKVVKYEFKTESE